MTQDEVGRVVFTAITAIKEFYIDYFEVREIYRGQGYGREIFRWIESYAKRIGMRVIYLAPYDSAINFWIKMGSSSASQDCDEMNKPLQ